MIEEIRKELDTLAEDGYRKFNEKLIPGVDNILGVRSAHLHRIAKKIAKGDWRSFIESTDQRSHEEVIIHGLVIRYISVDIEEGLRLTADFVPKITNWAICDCACGNQKFIKGNEDRVLEFILPYLDSEKEYDVRFGLVMLMGAFVNDIYIDRTLELLDNFHHTAYYAIMGAAWALSLCYFKYPEKTMHYLKRSRLDKVTYNKALQKIIESYQVSAEDKALIRAMKMK